MIILLSASRQIIVSMMKRIQKKTKKRVKTDKRDDGQMQIYANALSLFLEKSYDATSGP